MPDLSKNQQIKFLSEQLLKLIAQQENEETIEPPLKLWSEPAQNDDLAFETKKLNEYLTPKGRGSMGNAKSIEETLIDFERAGIDIQHVRLIMETVDRKHGSNNNFSVKESLFEELQKLMK